MKNVPAAVRRGDIFMENLKFFLFYLEYHRLKY